MWDGNNIKLIGIVRPCIRILKEHYSSALKTKSLRSVYKLLLPCHDSRLLTMKSTNRTREPSHKSFCIYYNMTPARMCQTSIWEVITFKTHRLTREVRRVVLFNLDKTQETIPYIVQRARDVDAINRRVVFLKPMAEIENFQLLPLKERHELLKWGLNDR